MNEEEDILMISTDLDQVEQAIDKSLQMHDFDMLNQMLDLRMQLFIKIEKYIVFPQVAKKIENIYNKDIERQKLLKDKLINIKVDQMKLQTGKKAITSGYYTMQEDLRSKEIDKQG
ncbi:MAG TPA: hypothetical protein PLA84_02325 [Petrotogaceae bacterium]|mgnify:FL=1|nr:hypothetical protein [Petrotogaceae bacterium]